MKEIEYNGRIKTDIDKVTNIIAFVGKQLLNAMFLTGINISSFYVIQDLNTSLHIIFLIIPSVLLYTASSIKNIMKINTSNKRLKKLARNISEQVDEHICVEELQSAKVITTVEREKVDTGIKKITEDKMEIESLQGSIYELKQLREELISLRNPEKKEYIKIKKLEKND